MRRSAPEQADRILAAAARLFATHRFHEARMDDVAALAEVGKGTLYRYFKDKEELYLALLDRAAGGLQERLHAAVSEGGRARRQLVAVAAAIIDYFDEQPHLFDLIQHAEAMQKPGTEFPWQRTRNQTMALVKGVLERGRDEGAFAIGDVDLAILMLLGGLRAVIRFGAKPRPAGLAEEIVGGFVEGFGRERPARKSGAVRAS